jgi:hypothetical protein
MERRGDFRYRAIEETQKIQAAVFCHHGIVKTGYIEFRLSSGCWVRCVGKMDGE